MSFCSIDVFTCEWRFLDSGHQRVVVAGEIDLATAPQLTDALDDAQAIGSFMTLIGGDRALEG